jgi:hypothetical protein
MDVDVTMICIYDDKLIGFEIYNTSKSTVFVAH